MSNAFLPNITGLYRSDAVRALERAAMTRAALDDDDLMARAGAAAWRLLLARWPDAQRIGVACGPGNNGGDGYALARIARASGRDVRVVVLPAPIGSDSAATRAAKSHAQAGGTTQTFDPTRSLPAADLWVDALFGIGLHRALDGDAAAFADALNAQPAPVLSLDVPSGVDADSGAAAGAAVRADATLAFIVAKPGLYTGTGREAAGVVAVDTLALGEDAFDGLDTRLRLVAPSALRHWLRPRARNAHKGNFGHVLCIGGDHGTGGAIALCAEAALRAGAGLVSVATRGAHAAGVLSRRPEAMVHAVEQDDAIAPAVDRASVIAIGPGLGTGDWGRALLERALSSRKPLVLDADALNLLAAQPQALHDTILTPHPGEAARLLGATVAQVQHDRIAAAEALASRHGGVVVLKGAGTVVAAQGEPTHVIDAGNPGMATGGMGDVLTGIVAALRAQGLRACDAAVCGALLHAAAGDAAAREGGERGLLPSDLFAHVRGLANP